MSPVPPWRRRVCGWARLLAVLPVLLLSGSLGAQTVAERIAAGDREHVAMRAASALAHYEAALRLDPHNADAHWRASNEATDLGEFDDRRRDSLYRVAEAYARRAVTLDSMSALAHFALAKALGRRALSLGPRDQVKYAAEVRAVALSSLRLDTLNPGALHVMGLWHASIMRLSGIARFLAKNLLGGRIFDEANWDDAARYLERAVAQAPDRIVHRLDLARVYRDRGETAQARAHYETALRLRHLEYNDPSYQRLAERELRELR